MTNRKWKKESWRV